MPRIPALARLLALLLSLVAVAAWGQTARISNIASLRFTDTGGAVREIRSNTVTLDTTRAKRPTTLAFYLPPPGYEFTGMSCRTSPTFAFTPAPIDEATFAASRKVAALDVYADMLLVLDNQAGNHDPAVRETATINAQVGQTSVKVPLLETGVDTGMFVGGVPATATGKYPELRPCDGRRQRGVRLTLSFGEDDFSLASSASLLIDPAGFVFDSRSGAHGRRRDRVAGRRQRRARDRVRRRRRQPLPSTVTSGARGHRCQRARLSRRSPADTASR